MSFLFFDIVHPTNMTPYLSMSTEHYSDEDPLTSLHLERRRTMDEQATT